MKRLFSVLATLTVVVVTLLVGLVLWVAFVKWAYDYQGWPFV